MKSALLSAC